MQKLARAVRMMPLWLVLAAMPCLASAQPSGLPTATPPPADSPTTPSLAASHTSSSLFQFYSMPNLEPLGTGLATLSPLDEANVSERLRQLKVKQQRGRQDEVRRELRDLASQYPTSVHAPEILYEAALLESEAALRLSELTFIAKHYRGTPWALKSLLEIGETNFLLQDFERALDAYQAYAIAGGPEANALEPRRKAVYCLMRLERYAAALPEIERLEADFPRYEAREEILALKAECSMALGNFAPAADALDTLLREYPNHALKPKALLLLGICREELRERDAARQAYGEILRAYPFAPFESRAARQRLTAMEASIFAPAPALEAEPSPPGSPATGAPSAPGPSRLEMDLSRIDTTKEAPAGYRSSSSAEGTTAGAPPPPPELAPERPAEPNAVAPMPNLPR